MKHQRSQYLNDCRSRLSILALVMTFFVLPYIADVPYLEDQTPTHDIEENSKIAGKTELDHDAISPLPADVRNDSVVGSRLTPQDVYKRMAHPPRGTPSFQHLFQALHISRPPPIA